MPKEERNSLGNRVRSAPYQPFPKSKSTSFSTEDINIFETKRASTIETDAKKLEQRQKQIDYGKNTRGYDIYISKVPKNARSRTDPRTPDKTMMQSKRAFDGRIKKWRSQLFLYDEKAVKLKEEANSEDRKENIGEDNTCETKVKYVDTVKFNHDEKMSLHALQNSENENENDNEDLDKLI